MNESRKARALEVRNAAAELAASRPHPRHIANGDEQKFRCPGNPSMPSYLASFTKGMPHDPKTGLVKDPRDFQQFVKGIDSGDPRDFKDTRLGPEGYQRKKVSVWHSTKARDAACSKDGLKLRGWESQAAGNTFDLEGPDAKAVTMPPVPVLGSHELTAEMGEVYAQALLRDVPFTQIVAGCDSYTVKCGKEKTTVKVKGIVKALTSLPWFGCNDGYTINIPSGYVGAGSSYRLNAHERSRVRTQLDGQTLFRGITPGDDIGPYISQFLLAGTEGRDKGGSPNEGRTPADGLINYGSITIDQRVLHAKPCDDHMTNWKEWLDVQHAADLGGMEQYSEVCKGNFRRFITTPRDMATYVHYDELYESYLNACILLLNHGIPFDPDMPFQQDNDVDHQQGFAHFGGPQILSLVTEVATRALKAVRVQKFNVHRRCRPEVLAARLTKAKILNQPELTNMCSDLSDILAMVAASNGKPAGNYLLPMAFCEGSPMHPAYGAGHATVAGACVTILKAFFDHKHPWTAACDDQHAFQPTEDGLKLNTVEVCNGRLTVEGELNKLASNISIGRDWAGVHFFTDYIESLRMGEQIAIGILEEQKLTYGETFSMTIPLFDGGSIRI